MKSSSSAPKSNYSPTSTSHLVSGDQTSSFIGNTNQESSSNDQQSAGDLEALGATPDEPADDIYPKPLHLFQLKNSSTETVKTELSSSDEADESFKPKMKKRENFIEKFSQDFDAQVEEIAEKATDLISQGSFFNCGLYQFISFLFVSIAWTVGNGWYAYVSVFTGYTPEHECDFTSMGNYTRYGNDSKCFALDLSTNEKVKCTKWTYDTSQMITTIITEYDFVCDKNYFFELAYSIEQIGYIVGTLIFSFVADVVGRKPVLLGVLISMSICGLLQYFVQNFTLYMIIGFVINSLACGLEAVCVTLVLEMFSTSKRTLFGIGIEVVWVIVLASMAPLAYFLKLWREIRLVIFAVLALLAIFSHFFVQESLRWLISLSKLEKASKIVEKISAYNGLSLIKNKYKKKFDLNNEQLNKLFNELELYNKLQLEQDLGVKNVGILNSDDLSPPQLTLGKRSNNTIWDIARNKKFRLYVLIMSLNWFATALVYDGLTYLNNYIGENIFFNWIAMNLIELPAQFVCYFVISRYGRRLTVSFTLILAGCTLLATFIETFEAIEKLNWVKLALFILAKFIVTQSYSGVILHAPELFPTNLRSFGYGICLFSGKITSVISPMISIYLSKIYPSLPAMIYGAMSIVCGIISLYVPETLNRSLPNSIDDVVKWPRNLTEEEWRVVKEMNRVELSVFGLCKKKISKSKSRVDICKGSITGQENSSLNGSDRTKIEELSVHKSNTLPSLISSCEKTQLSGSTSSSNFNLNKQKLSVQFTASSSTDSEFELDLKENLNILSENKDVIVI